MLVDQSKPATMQRNRPVTGQQSITCENPGDRGNLRGLKIPVSAVRFRPWAQVDAENAEKLSQAVSGVLPHCAELPSNSRPGGRS
jgi:hypothetical protein